MRQRWTLSVEWVPGKELGEVVVRRVVDGVQDTLYERTISPWTAALYFWKGVSVIAGDTRITDGPLQMELEEDLPSFLRGPESSS